MGTWGAGILENDAASDFFQEHIERMMMEIRMTMRCYMQIHAGSYYGEVIPAMIAVLTELCGFHFTVLDTDELIRWKRIFMERWRNTIDDTEPTAEYRKERERVLTETFDKLIALSKRK